MAHLSAIATLNLGPVLGLRAVSREMAELLTVAAHDIVRVARLIALLGNMVLRAAVATGPRWTCLNVGAVLGEVAHLVTLATLDILGGSWLRTLLGDVALLLAVLAGVGVDTLLLAITRAVAGLLTVNAGDRRRSLLALDNLLLAVLADVAKF
jgi:hypothetical protein